MARSSYIYLVFHRTGRLPIGAFTVKHEMVTWIKREYYNAFRNGALAAYRMSDGVYQNKPEEIDLKKENSDER